MRRITPREHIENFFTTEPLPDCLIERDRIDLILKVRGGPQTTPKRERKRKVKDSSVPILRDVRGDASA
jgi:hypothetical protein